METTTATISYSIGFDGPDVSAYDRVEKAVYEYLLFAAKGELHLRYSAKGGTPGATVPRARRAEASAGLRVLLRGVLRGKLGKAFRVRAFLKVDWTNTYSGLSDAARPARQPSLPPFRIRGPVCASLACTLLKRHRSLPGHSIAAVRALKSSLSRTAGGQGA